MISLLLAAVLAQADAGTTDAGTDAGFLPVVLDVNRGALWVNFADGGISDAPLIVHGGIYADDATSLLLGKSSARGIAERGVSPDVDMHTVLTVAGVMLLLGAVVGFVFGFELGRLSSKL